MHTQIRIADLVRNWKTADLRRIEQLEGGCVGVGHRFNVGVGGKAAQVPPWSPKTPCARCPLVTLKLFTRICLSPSHRCSCLAVALLAQDGRGACATPV